MICAGGGGIPTVYPSNGTRILAGVEAVIDKDLASERLARELNADVFIMATDVDGVYLNFRTPEQRLFGRISASELKGYRFPDGSMGPKVAAAIQFVEITGRRAGIGALADIEAIIEGEKGTNVVPSPLESTR